MSNLPAIPTAQEFETMKELGRMAISSGFLPQSIKTPEQATIIILKGREIGIQPMQAFSGINVIQGKPAVSPELMLTLIYKNVPGAVVNYVRNDAETCVIEAKRPGGKMNRFEFSMKDAQIAGLAGKGNWKTYPAAMLRARCISVMARALFPDAIAGCSYTPEELDAETDEEGNVVETPRDVSQPPVDPGEDGIEAAKKEVSDPRDYVIEGGKLKDKSIREIIAQPSGAQRLKNYLNALKTKYAEDNRPLPTWAVFLKVNFERCEALLAEQELDQAYASAMDGE